MGKSIRGTQTEQNLLIAFAGECQSKNRYEFYAEAAKAEGYQQIANLFERTAFQEQSHAKQYFKFLEGRAVEIKVTYGTEKLGNTFENLQTAVNKENNEYSNLYPKFSEIAKEEGFPAVAAIFRIIAKIESGHALRFLKYLKRIEEGTVFQREIPVRWECIKCGYIHEGTEPPKICPGCNHPIGYFEEAND